MFHACKKWPDFIQGCLSQIKATTLTSKTSFTCGLQKLKFCPRNLKDLELELKDSNKVIRYLMNHQLLHQHIFC